MLIPMVRYRIFSTLVAGYNSSLGLDCSAVSKPKYASTLLQCCLVFIPLPAYIGKMI